MLFTVKDGSYVYVKNYSETIDITIKEGLTTDSVTPEKAANNLVYREMRKYFGNRNLPIASCSIKISSDDALYKVTFDRGYYKSTVLEDYTLQRAEKLNGSIEDKYVTVERDAQNRHFPEEEIESALNEIHVNIVDITPYSDNLFEENTHLCYTLAYNELETAIECVKRHGQSIQDRIDEIIIEGRF